MRNLFWRSQQTLVSLQDRKTDCAKKDEDQFVHFLTGIGITTKKRQWGEQTPEAKDTREAAKRPKGGGWGALAPQKKEPGSQQDLGRAPRNILEPVFTFRI